MNAPVIYSDQALDILECMSDAFYSVDPDWRILYANRRTEWIWGVKRADILCKSLWDVTADFRFARSTQELRRAMADRTPVTFETYSLYFESHIEVDAYPARHGGLDVYFRNITGRKRVEQFNREAEHMLQLATHAAGIGFWQWNTATDEMHTLNTSPFVPEEWHHNNFEESIRSVHPDDRDMVQRLLIESKRSKQQYKCRLRRVLPNGKVVWVNSQGEVVLDQNGDVRQVIGVNYGVSEQRSMQTDERQSMEILPEQQRERDLLNLLQAGCDGYWIVDYLQSTKESSAPWKQLCCTESSSPAEEFQADSAHIHPEDRQRVTASLQEALRCRQEKHQDEYRVKTGQGERWFLVKMRITYTDDGRPHRRYATALDITERKTREAQLLQRSSLWVNFAHRIAFNLKSLLSIVLLAIDMVGIHAKIAQQNKENRLDRYVGVLRQNVYRLMRLMGNLNDITLLDTGTMSTSVQNFDLVQEIQELVHMANYQLLGRDVTIEWRTDCDTLPMKTDRDKLQRVLLNLLSNALRHTERPGCITIALSSASQRAHICVCNEGDRIPQEKLKNLFDRTSSVEIDSLYQDGNGMGLHLSKSFVELMQGRIWVECLRDRGACFHVELPLELEYSPTGNIVIDSLSLMRKVEMEFSDLQVR